MLPTIPTVILIALFASPETGPELRTEVMFNMNHCTEVANLRIELYNKLPDTPPMRLIGIYCSPEEIPFMGQEAWGILK